MKFKDLIARLQQENPDAEVVNAHPNGGYFEVVGAEAVDLWKRQRTSEWEGDYNAQDSEYARKQPTIHCVEIL